MYKFATHVLAAVGIFSIGVLSGATLIMFSYDLMEPAKNTNAKNDLDDLDKAWSDVQATLK